MRYDCQKTDPMEGSATMNGIIPEIEKRFGFLTRSEQDGILNTYKRLSDMFSAYEDEYACLLVEWDPGTTLPIFGNSDEHFPNPIEGIETAGWIDTGTMNIPGPAFVRMNRKNHRVQDCLFFLRITGKPTSCEIIPASRGYWGVYRYGSMLWPEFEEYLIRYLLKEVRGTDHDFRFTLTVGNEAIFAYFDQRLEFLEQGLLNHYLNGVADNCQESAFGRVTLTHMEKNLGFRIPKRFADLIPEKFQRYESRS